MGKCSVVPMAMPCVAYGFYNGDGAEARTIELGFFPGCVVLTEDESSDYKNSEVHGGMALRDKPLDGGPSSPALRIAQNGFTVYNKGFGLTNTAGRTYRYIAFH